MHHHSDLERLNPTGARLSLGRWPRSALLVLLSAVSVVSSPSAAASDLGTENCAFQIRVVSERKPVVGAKWVVAGRDEKPETDQQGLLCVTDGSEESLASYDLEGPVEGLIIAEGFVVTRARVDVVAAVKTEQPEGPLVQTVELVPAFGEEMVVSANRYERRLLDVPVHIQRVGRDAIAASSSRTLADAVEYASGVRVESNCQNCNFSQVRMLGLEGPYSQILVDGQPSLSSLALVYGIEQIPAASLDSIEITKGGGSALYGAGAVGGTINLIPRTVDHTGLHIEATGMRTGGEPGSSVMAFGELATTNRRHGVTVLLQTDELDPSDLDGDGFSEVTSRELQNYNLRYQSLLLEDRAQVAADLNYTDSNRRGGDLVRFDLPPDQTALTEAIATERGAGTVRWLHQASASFDLRLAGSLSSTTRDSYYGADFDPGAYGTTDGEVLLGDLQMNRYFGRGTLTFGAQYLQDQTVDVQPAYGRFLDETFDTVSLFAQDDRKVAKGLTLLYGLRIDDHSAIADPIVSPRVSVLYAPHSKVSLRASVASGFRPPATFDEDLHIELVGGGRARVVRNDPDLKEEGSLGTVVSAEWKPTYGKRGTGAFEIVAFRTRLDDLFFDQEADDPTTDALELLKTNLGEATVEGVEVAAAYRYNSMFFVEAALVHQSAEFSQPEPDFGSRDFFRTPERYGSLNLQAELPWKLDLFAGILYTGPMKAPHYAGFIKEDRLETTPEFTTFSLGISRTFALPGDRELKLGLSAKNFTDEYQEDLDQGPLRDSAYVYGPRLPRAVSFTVGLEF